MFTAKRLMFLYAVTPVHLGAGTAIGVIDNPIQRERHTEHPVFAGSGLKGALRQVAEGQWRQDPGKVARVFGPDTNAAEHAGAASFADAQVVAFPVRSLKEGYVYATSPYALHRLGRLAEIAGAAGFPADALPPLTDSQAVVRTDRLLAKRDDKDKGRLILESYAFDPLSDNGALVKVAAWLAQNALPPGPAHQFFRDKLASDLVLLSDTQFSFFVSNSTVVEPHVRIDDSSGTAADGGLFFTENLPPESLMASLVMASVERRKKGDGGAELTPAEAILKTVTDTFSSTTVQIGGDATTGRGQVVVSFVGG
jgi:CRISPR-associated protein Cmr4